MIAPPVDPTTVANVPISGPNRKPPASIMTRPTGTNAAVATA